MKTIFRTIAIVVATVFASSAFAQMPEGGQRPERGQFSPENMAKMQTEQMAQSLKLSDEQLQAVYELNLANATAQMKEMEEQRQRQQARESATDEAMKSILDESQYKKWTKQKKQQQQNRMNRGMGGPGGMGGFGGPRMGGGFPPQGGFGAGPGGNAPEDMKAMMEEMRKTMEQKRKKAGQTLEKKMKKILKGEDFARWQQWEDKRKSQEKPFNLPARPFN